MLTRHMKGQSRRFGLNLNLLISCGINSGPSGRIMWNVYFLFLFPVRSNELISNLLVSIWFITPSGITMLPLFKTYQFCYYLSCSCLGPTASQVWGLNLTLRLFWTVSVPNPVVCFLYVSLEDAVGTATLCGWLRGVTRTMFCCGVSQGSRTAFPAIDAASVDWFQLTLSCFDGIWYYSGQIVPC